MEKNKTANTNRKWASPSGRVRTGSKFEEYLKEGEKDPWLAREGTGSAKALRWAHGWEDSGRRAQNEGQTLTPRGRTGAGGPPDVSTGPLWLSVESMLKRGPGWKQVH